MPVGTYTVNAKYLGYNDCIQENVRVHVETDTKCDFLVKPGTPHEVDTIIILPIAQPSIKSARTGVISGTVISTHNYPMIGAFVSINGTNFEAVTDSVGFYKIINVPEGNYTVRAENRERNTESILDVKVHFGKESKCDFILITDYR